MLLGSTPTPSRTAGDGPSEAFTTLVQAIVLFVKLRDMVVIDVEDGEVDEVRRDIN